MLFRSHGLFLRFPVTIEVVFKSRKAAEMKINKTDWNLVSAFFFGLQEAVEHEKKLKEQKDQETEE